MLKPMLAGLSMLTLALVPAQAADSPDRLYDRIVAEVVAPGFSNLASAARRHAAGWQSFCAAPSEALREGLIVSFNDTADRWAEVEIFRSGPSSRDFRHERFHFWPERKNAVSRGLAALRAGSAAATPAQVSAASAAVQGLPALERLIFDDELAADRCKLGPAIATNAAELASQMQAAWTTPAPMASTESRTALATDLVTSFAVIKDDKIEAVIGKTPAEVKPKAAEAWRSARSLRNISHNLEGLARVTSVLASSLPEDAALVSTTLQAQRIAAGLSGDLGAMAAGDRRFEAILLRDAVDAAEDRAVIGIPAALGVTIGFNSLDGD